MHGEFRSQTQAPTAEIQRCGPALCAHKRSDSFPSQLQTSGVSMYYASARSSRSSPIEHKIVVCSGKWLGLVALA